MKFVSSEFGITRNVIIVLVKVIKEKQHLIKKKATSNEVYYKRGSPNNWQMMNPPYDYQNRN